MKQGTGLAVGVVIGALVAGGGGYWLGTKDTPQGGTEQASAAGLPSESGKKERKLLYYRNPMGLPDTSPTPKKDPMGMDYLPVYEGEDTSASDSAGTIKVSTEKVQKLGVRTEAAQLRVLDKVDVERERLANLVQEVAYLRLQVADAARLAPGATRVQFRYDWLTTDLDLIERAIREHLDAPRQPRAIVPLKGDYRR